MSSDSPQVEAEAKTATSDAQNPRLVSYVSGFVRSIMITELDESGSTSSESTENENADSTSTTGVVCESELEFESEKQHTTSEMEGDDGEDAEESSSSSAAENSEAAEDSVEDSETVVEPEDELKARLKWLYAIRIVKDFARKYDRGVYFVDEFEGIMCDDDLYENIRGVKVSYTVNGFTISQTFDATHGKHIVENIKIPKSGHTYISAALCSLVKKFGYNLEYKMDFEITVFTNKYVYMCDSQINGEYMFNYQSVFAGTS